jgi:hypothetical protein
MFCSKNILIIMERIYKKLKFTTQAQVCYLKHIFFKINFPAGSIPTFDVVTGLAGSTDPEGHAGCSVATGRATLAGQVKGDDTD